MPVFILKPTDPWALGLLVDYHNYCLNTDAPEQAKILLEKYKDFESWLQMQDARTRHAK